MSFKEKMGSSLGCAFVLLFLAYGLVQIGAGYVGIREHWGSGWAIGALVACFVFHFSLPLTIGAFFAARDVWGWHTVFALLFAAPGLAFMALLIPGAFASVVSTLKNGKCLGNNNNPTAIVARDTFKAAGDVFDTAYHAIEVYTKRANHRDAILDARHARHTNPDDFDPYTAAYLDDHTAAIETLTDAFDNLTTAFSALYPTVNSDTKSNCFYKNHCELYKVYCELYALSVNSYSKAAMCSLPTALQGMIRAIENQCDAMVLEAAASQAADGSDTAKTAAMTFKSKTAFGATKAEKFVKQAEAAKTKAEILVAKAQSAVARAEKMVTSNP